MFPKSYFGARYYAPSFFPPIAGGVIPPAATGGPFPFPARRRGRR